MRLEKVRQRRLAILGVAAFALVSGVVAAAKQSDGPQDQKFSGAWVGSYTNSGGVEGNLKFSLRKEEKGEWQGQVTFTNQDGEHTLELKPLQIAAGKFKAKAANEEVEIAIEGELHGERLEGTYSVKPIGATEVVESGSWKVAKEPAAKSDH